MKKNRKIYLLILVFLSLFMCVGYATVNSVILNITGNVQGDVYDELFITNVNVVYDDADVNDDNSGAVINVFDGTFLNSSITLSGDNPNAFITYQITILNNSNYSQMYKQVEYSLGEGTYDNENIVFDELIGLMQGDVLGPKESITFTMKFHFKDNVLPSNFSLNSNLNFLFMKSYAGSTLLEMFEDFAYPDNTSSRFVSNVNGIDFANVASDENGKGLYITADSLDDEYPIYYYRGSVDNNNLVIDRFCWKILHTTETGGTKLLYNGLRAEDGSCNNTGDAAALETKTYYSSLQNASGIGYYYTKSLALSSQRDAVKYTPEGTIFASDATWNPETGLYELSDDVYLSSANLTADKYENLKDHHYTCNSTTATTCSSVRYIHMGRDALHYFITLSNGQTVDSFLNLEFDGNSTNATASNISTVLKNWYASNLLSYDSYFEDTVFCNDRSIFNREVWSNNAIIDNVVEARIHFGARGRLVLGDKRPTYECKYKADSFSRDTDIGNGVLDYPIGLITADEVAFAGCTWGGSCSHTFVINGSYYWSMSPGFLSAANSYITLITSSLDNVTPKWTSAGGVRPVVSLKAGIAISDGFGTPDLPFTIFDSNN